MPKKEPAIASSSNWIVNLSEQCDLFLTIGTSALVHSAASLPLVALERGVVTVEINPDTTRLTPLGTYALQRPAGQILPTLVERLEAQ